jgi:hypothetical protein
VAVEFDHDTDEMLALAPDWEATYLDRLARRHRARAIRADQRLWTEAAVAAAEGRPAPSPTLAKRRAAG